jgi:hypothetical protein
MMVWRGIAQLYGQLRQADRLVRVPWSRYRVFRYINFQPQRKLTEAIARSIVDSHGDRDFKATDDYVASQPAAAK